MNAQFPIQDDIPIPPPVRERMRYPFAELEVRQSFYVRRPKDVGSATFSNRMSARCAHAAKRLGRVFRCRTVVEDGREGVRVWRVA